MPSALPLPIPPICSIFLDSIKLRLGCLLKNIYAFPPRWLFPLKIFTRAILFLPDVRYPFGRLEWAQLTVFLSF